MEVIKIFIISTLERTIRVSLTKRGQYYQENPYIFKGNITGMGNIEAKLLLGEEYIDPKSL